MKLEPNVPPLKVTAPLKSILPPKFPPLMVTLELELKSVLLPISPPPMLTVPSKLLRLDELVKSEPGQY